MIGNIRMKRSLRGGAAAEEEEEEEEEEEQPAVCCQPLEPLARLHTVSSTEKRLPKVTLKCFQHTNTG
jgi:hypothetical protein